MNNDLKKSVDSMFYFGAKFVSRACRPSFQRSIIRIFLKNKIKTTTHQDGPRQLIPMWTENWYSDVVPVVSGHLYIRSCDVLSPAFFLSTFVFQWWIVLSASWIVSRMSLNRVCRASTRLNRILLVYRNVELRWFLTRLLSSRKKRRALYTISQVHKRYDDNIVF